MCETKRVGAAARLRDTVRQRAWSTMLVLAGMALLAIAAGCEERKDTADPALPKQGAPKVESAQVAQILDGACSKCHNAGRISLLLSDITALDDAAFTASSFPDANFPGGLTKLTVQRLIEHGDPVEDASFSAGMPARKAWILHELHELKGLLAEDVPPDFTSQAAFDAFAVLGKPGHYEGCEVIEKLDLGHDGNPEGMPPLWSSKLGELLNIDFAPVSPKDREALKAYTLGLFPGDADQTCD